MPARVHFQKTNSGVLQYFMFTVIAVISGTSYRVSHMSLWVPTHLDWRLRVVTNPSESPRGLWYYIGKGERGCLAGLHFFAQVLRI